VSLTDWLLAFHVAAAFAVVASVTVSTIVILAVRRTDDPADAVALFRVGAPAAILVQVGSVLTLLLGIWLAIRLPQYHPWDGWLIGAYVLWLVAGGFGARTGMAYGQLRGEAEAAANGGAPGADLRAKLRASEPFMLHLITMAAVLGILLLMIFKPGA
jgi:uncharacterized membrane protein